MSQCDEAVEPTDDDHKQLAYATVHVRPQETARVDIVEAFDGCEGVCKLRIDTADLLAGAFLSPAEARDLGEDLIAFADRAGGDDAE